jgi:hypothetical protein
MEPLAELEAVEARLDWPLDSREIAMANAALEEASDLAREYGRESWSTPATTPRLVRGLVVTAVARYLRNPDGYLRSRAGDEVVEWADTEDASGGGVYFTRAEIRLLRGVAGTVAFSTAPVIAWDTKPPPTIGYVPTAGGAPFPMFADDREPW